MLTTFLVDIIVLLVILLVKHYFCFYAIMLLSINIVAIMHLEVCCSMDTNSLSSNIRSARQRANLSQAELAKLLSKSQTTVAAWETGRSQPDASTIIRLCEILNISSDQLLGLSAPGYENVSASQHEILRALKWLLVFSDMGLIVPNIQSDENSEWLQEAELKEPLNKLILIHYQMKELKQLATSDPESFSDDFGDTIDEAHRRVLSNISQTIAKMYKSQR
ncbi:hypothetical protein B5F12_04025 [Pseudoflavonifractor sp. An176]|nr:hypothetical protein B5F12_04025 [Pseudoflavonifractor sp. An176]